MNYYLFTIYYIYIIYCFRFSYKIILINYNILDAQKNSDKLVTFNNIIILFKLIYADLHQFIWLIPSA